jgi:hypothetical protein
MNTLKIVQDTREFFDLKSRLQIELEEYEKKIFSEKENLNKIYNTFYELKSFVRKSNSNYFQIKVNSLETQLNLLTQKRKYQKIEFDRVFKTLEKIKETESSEFLNQAISDKIQKIAENLSPYSKPIFENKKEGDKFYRFSYKGLDYLVKAFPKKFILGADVSKKFLRIGEDKFPIYPTLQIDEEKFESCNILILKVRTSIKCYRYEILEDVFDIPYLNFEKKLIKLDISTSEINSYIRYKGKRHYFIDI